MARLVEPIQVLALHRIDPAKEIFSGTKLYEMMNSEYEIKQYNLIKK